MVQGCGRQDDIRHGCTGRDLELYLRLLWCVGGYNLIGFGNTNPFSGSLAIRNNGGQMTTNTGTVYGYISTGTVTINGGASATNLTAVTLALTCGNTNGCSQMKFSNDNITFTTPEAFVATKAWTLSSAEGSKTVHAKLLDAAGEWQPVSDIIIYDTTPPTTTASPVGGLYNTGKTVTLTCSDGSGAGCSKIYYTTNGTTPTTASTFLPGSSGTIAVASSMTINYFALDAAGNSETVKSQTYTIDTTPPIGTITVNGGATTTTSTTVTLTLSCSDTYGCTQMQFSSDGASWSMPQTYATSASWTLPPTVGNQTVYAKFKDSAGNWSATSATDTINLVQAYTIPLYKNLGAVTTTSTLTTLIGYASPYAFAGTVPLYVDNWGSVYTSLTNVCGDDGTGTGGTICLNTTLLGYANANSFARATAIKNSAGMIYTSTGTTYGYLSSGTVTINSGAAATNSTTVNLALTCGNTNGCSQMKFSNNNLTWSTATAYSATTAWTLSTGAGTKTVYAKIQDGAGNWQPVSSTIIYDTTAPTGTLSINNGATSTATSAVTLTLTCTDTGSGCSQMEFSNDNVTWSTAEVYTTSKAWTLISGAGTKTVYTKFMDAAGNWSAVISKSIALTQ